MIKIEGLVTMRFRKKVHLSSSSLYSKFPWKFCIYLLPPIFLLPFFLIPLQTAIHPNTIPKLLLQMSPALLLPTVILGQIFKLSAFVIADQTLLGFQALRCQKHIKIQTHISTYHLHISSNPKPLASTSSLSLLSTSNPSANPLTFTIH